MASTKEPKYAVEVREGDFELRLYGTHAVAETQVTGDWSDAGNEGFRRLAGYIFGKNRGRSKIAMTAPVAQAASLRDGQEGLKIPMTAPVAQRREGGMWTVAFTMPEGETPATLPQPDDPRVVLRELPPERVAVVRFSGRWTVDNMKKHEDSLRQWVSARQLHVVGQPEVNRYDPPFKPWFLRRNEIWLRLADDVRAVSSP
ncbi:MAG TPA: heme-binding protein [Myxococcota bacterium]|nr:heme-binding protein [Myxococcota bacterium]